MAKNKKRQLGKISPYTYVGFISLSITGDGDRPWYDGDPSDLQVMPGDPKL